VSPVKYELGFFIAEDDILHSDRRENLKSYIIFPHVQRFVVLNTINGLTSNLSFATCQATLPTSESGLLKIQTPAQINYCDPPH
jgi:hypothetical protein